MNWRKSRALLWLVVVLAAAGGMFLASRPGPPAPAAPIGGPFQLVDHHGAAVTQADFAGRYMLIFFGYTFCPDVCPVELATISAALDQLAERGFDIDRVAPLFITVDPERDTVEAMARYVAAFHPRLVGLTGDRAAVDAAAKAYGVYAAKAGDGEDYLVDHTSLIYLAGADGRVIAIFPPRRPPDELAAGILAALAGADDD